MAATQDNPMTRVKNQPASDMPAESAEQKRINDLEMQLLRMSEGMEALQRQLASMAGGSVVASPALVPQPILTDLELERQRRQAEDRVKAAKLRRTYEQGWKAEEELFAGKHKFLCVYEPEPSMTRVVGCDYQDGDASQGVCDVKFRRYFGITGFAAGKRLILTPWNGTEADLPEKQRQRRAELRDNLNS